MEERRVNHGFVTLLDCVIGLISGRWEGGGGGGAGAGEVDDHGAGRAVALMTPVINIGTTLENTAGWETGWGYPLITREYVHGLAGLGLQTVRRPAASDTYEENGRIIAKQFERVA